MGESPRGFVPFRSLRSYENLLNLQQVRTAGPSDFRLSHLRSRSALLQPASSSPPELCVDVHPSRAALSLLPRRAAGAGEPDHDLLRRGPRGNWEKLIPWAPPGGNPQTISFRVCGLLAAWGRRETECAGSTFCVCIRAAILWRRFRGPSMRRGLLGQEKGAAGRFGRACLLVLR